jgi:putative phosphoribosyl transferase
MTQFTDSVTESAVRIPVVNAALNGDLAIPQAPTGLILFAHGSGSSRKSPRNRAVAAELWTGGFGTLLLDLLTNAEEQIDNITAQHRFDIELLAKRLEVAVDWARTDPRTATLPIGLFGASTGAAAALVAAAAMPNDVKAVVSRGGRPDLALPVLDRVRAPTLLIVGGDDLEVIALNQRALRSLGCAKQLSIVPGATHLFEEPGTLEQVSELARAWFTQRVAASAPRLQGAGAG